MLRNVGAIGAMLEDMDALTDMFDFGGNADSELVTDAGTLSTRLPVDAETEYPVTMSALLIKLHIWDHSIWLFLAASAWCRTTGYSAS
jgi:hypothetical protein